MAKVRVLPPELADQIAAGEVVERPASVVKELVENALDAGARRIEVDIEAGGRRLVRVVDDGWGMAPDDARLALRRHATSKIASADDLWGLRDVRLPRRGAAVDRGGVAADAGDAARPARTAGFKLTVEAGVETDAREAGMPAGTQIEVRDLFFNTPARAKFLQGGGDRDRQRLRGDAAAGAGASRRAPPAAGLRARSRSTCRRTAISANGCARRSPGAARARCTRPTARRTGTACAPSSPRPRRRQHGARRRSCSWAGVSCAIARCCTRWRWATARCSRRGATRWRRCSSSLPGGDVDVNVHPQKLEVRFARAQEVYAAVRHVVGAAIARAPWLRDGGGAHGPMRTFTQPPARSATLDDGGARTGRHRRRRGGAAAAGAGRAAAARARRGRRRRRRRRRRRSTARWRLDRDAPRFFAGLTYVGQVHRTYLVCEAADELILIDQHAAHERVAYARLRAAHARRQMPRQQLLFPIPIEVGEAAAAAVEADDVLGGLGFEVTRAGHRASCCCARCPSRSRTPIPKPLVREVLAELADGTPLRDGELDRVDHLLATIACHSVVRAGDVLGRRSAGAARAARRGRSRSHCPHGRPVLLRMPLAEIERRFGRV